MQLSHVNVARGENVVLHNINLSVNAGENIAILGRARWDLTELKKRLGVVSPELPGRHTLTTTGRDAVLTGFFSASTLWPNLTVTEAMQARADEVLAKVDAVPLANKPVGEMSPGQ